MKSGLYRKLFVNHSFFTIAIKRKEKQDFIDSGIFKPDYVFKASRELWQADPILVEDGGKAYLFYEKVSNDKGHIEVVEVFEDCTVGKPEIVLESDYHYSYPFVFRYNNTWYMIPEASASHEVVLYKAEKFPYTWKREAVLLKERAVDTTVFNYCEKTILITFFLKGNTERVEPHAFEFHLDQDNYSLIPLRWDDFDELRVRGAGPIIMKDNRYVRPAQISEEQRYGDGLVFYDIVIDDSYRETKISEVLKSNVMYKNKDFYVDGLHTYSSSSKFEVIDMRGGIIDYFKPFKRLINRFHKK